MLKTICVRAASAAGVAMAALFPAPQVLQSEIHALVKEAAVQVELMQSLESQIDAYLNEHTRDPEAWSVSVALPDSGLQIDFGNEPQTAASSIKLFLCAAVMEYWDTLDMDAETLNDLVAASLIVSDNEAATALVAILGHGDIAAGKEVVNAFCKAHGYDQTYMGIIFAGLDPTGTYNATTSPDIVHFLCDLLDGTLAGSKTLLEYMALSERIEKIPAALPEGVQSANKTGELEETENDAAIVYGNDRTFVISIMSDTIFPDEAVEEIKELTAMAYRQLEGE